MFVVIFISSNRHLNRGSKGQFGASSIFQQGLGKASISYYCFDMKLHMVIDFEYCHIVIRHKCCLCLVLEAVLH